MRKAIIAAAGAAALGAFAVAGCGGGTHSGGGNGAPNGGWRSPYQEQQANKAAGQVCDNINMTPTGNDIADAALTMGFGVYLNGIEQQLTMSRDDAIAWIKSVAKDQCPEFIGNISKWTANQ